MSVAPDPGKVIPAVLEWMLMYTGNLEEERVFLENGNLDDVAPELIAIYWEHFIHHRLCGNDYEFPQHADNSANCRKMREMLLSGFETMRHNLQVLIKRLAMLRQLAKARADLPYMIDPVTWQKYNELLSKFGKSDPWTQFQQQLRPSLKGLSRDQAQTITVLLYVKEIENEWLRMYNDFIL